MSSINKVILIGNRNELQEIAGEIDLSDITIINPCEYDKYEEYGNAFYELRKAKGMTIEQARETLKHNIYFGTMMVKRGDADGLVAGSVCSTADTLRPALQILKTAPGVKLVSSFFIMTVPNCELGEDGMFLFSDCGLNVNPNEEELSEIAISSAKSWKQLTDKEARVSMLSYSTFGSAPLTDMTSKVINATKLVKEKMPEATSIFIMPPSLEDLEARLRGRSTESEEAIQRRLGAAAQEIEAGKSFDYRIINDNI